ncbi:MAG: hypothetical protein JSU77_06740 [Fidelibacterota bacterium]|nr:MAG: hypothetical protein JSU77_06740 [Candidatus Neomarinimicrobiota bacterium]
MNKLVMHRIVVQDPENMELDPNTEQPICPECDNLFNQCPCPKSWSTLDTDGYMIVSEGEVLIAYPSKEVYEELALWIFRNREYLICSHCMQWIKAEWYWSEEVTEQVVETFFSVHSLCPEGRLEI